MGICKTCTCRKRSGVVENLLTGAYTITFVDDPAFRSTTANEGTFNLDPGQRLTITDYGVEDDLHALALGELEDALPRGLRGGPAALALGEAGREAPQLGADHAVGEGLEGLVRLVEPGLGARQAPVAQLDVGPEDRAQRPALGEAVLQVAVGREPQAGFVGGLGHPEGGVDLVPLPLADRFTRRGPPLLRRVQQSLTIE